MLSSTTGPQWDVRLARRPPLCSMAYLPVISCSVTLVRASSVTKISLNHLWSTFSCSVGIVLCCLEGVWRWGLVVLQVVDYYFLHL